MMRENQSYVFFRELTGPGPLGALGLPVTPRVTRRRRSAASCRSARRCCSTAWTIRAPTACGSRRIPAARSRAPTASTPSGARARRRRRSPAACRRAAAPICCCRAARCERIRAPCAGSALRSARSGARSSRRVRPLARRRRRRPKPADADAAAPAAAARPRAGRRRRAARSRSPGTTLDGSWDRRLSRGLVQPDRTLDLHGHSLATAYDLLDRRLEQAIATGARVLLLITGKPPRRTAGASAARSAPRSATGSPPRAMPATSPRCATPIRAMAARARSTSSCDGSAPKAPERPDHPRVDALQRADVVDRGRLVELVHGRVGQAEIDHRAERDQEAAVRGAAMGGEARASRRSRPRSRR